MSDMKGVTNAEAAGSAVPMKTSSGNIRKADMALSLDSPDPLDCLQIQEGDTVVYIRDGVRGIVIRSEGEKHLILWEDTFVSWEPEPLLRRL